MKLPQVKLPRIKIYGIDLIKNSLFFGIYILLTLIIITFTLAPSIKILKQENQLYTSTKEKFEITTKEYNQFIKELTKLKSTNKNIIIKLKTKFDLSKFKLFSSSYIQIKKVSFINKKRLNNFIITSFLITANIKTPQDFYNLIDKIKDYNNIIQIYFPIEFEKNKEDINLTFKIKIFNLKE